MLKESESGAGIWERSLGSRWLWAAAVVVLFLLQAVPYLSHRWVTDESWYAATGYSIQHGDGVKDPAVGPNDLENHFDARPPGTALVIASAFRAFGESASAARLGSIFAGAMVVLLLYLLARDLLGAEAAVMVGLLAATDNLLVLTSRTARPDALTTMGVLLGLLTMRRYANRGALAWAFASGLVMAATTMFHVTVLGWIASLALLAVAVDWRLRRIPVRGALAYAVAYAVGLLPFAAWILRSPLGPAGFRQEFLHRATERGFAAKLLGERARYSDFFGVHMLHVRGLEDLPVRLPIPLFFVFASYLLWRYRRSWFCAEMMFLLPTMVWFVLVVNKVSRYLVLLSPVVALTVGAALVAVAAQPKLKRAVLALTAVVVCAQFGANLLLMQGARVADYQRVRRDLETVIPPGATVYGTITFWLAMHRHGPYISYERTEPAMAANDFHARYYILGDRMLTYGSATDAEYYAELREQLKDVVAHGTLVGEFQEPYYGDLKVIRIPDAVLPVPAR